MLIGRLHANGATSFSKKCIHNLVELVMKGKVQTIYFLFDYKMNYYFFLISIVYTFLRIMRDINNHPAYLNCSWDHQYLNELKKYKNEVQMYNVACNIQCCELKPILYYYFKKTILLLPYFYVSK